MSGRVGTGPPGMAQPPIVLPPTAIVTAPVAPVPAMARPRRLPVTVMLASAMTFPKKVAESMVAELPICQYTLQGFAEPTSARLANYRSRIVQY